jgi:hypothetical protein
VSTPTSGAVRPEMLHAHASMRHVGDRRYFINDEGNLKGPRAPEHMQEAADVIEVIDPAPITRRAGQYVRRLRRLDQASRRAQRRTRVGAW